jgi:hypothetical protein
LTSRSSRFDKATGKRRFKAATLWIEKVKQFFFFVLAERGSDAHMAHNCAGYAR